MMEGLSDLHPGKMFLDGGITGARIAGLESVCVGVNDQEKCSGFSAQETEAKG